MYAFILRNTVAVNEENSIAHTPHGRIAWLYYVIIKKVPAFYVATRLIGVNPRIRNYRSFIILKCKSFLSFIKSPLYQIMH